MIRRFCDLCKREVQSDDGVGLSIVLEQDKPTRWEKWSWNDDGCVTHLCDACLTSIADIARKRAETLAKETSRDGRTIQN